MKDPQAGQSRGRISSPCCEVVIDRVAANLSYGHLENITMSLDGLPAHALQIDEELKTRPTNDRMVSPRAKSKESQKMPETKVQEAPPKLKTEDGKW